MKRKLIVSSIYMIVIFLIVGIVFTLDQVSIATVISHDIGRYWEAAKSNPDSFYNGSPDLPNLNQVVSQDIKFAKFKNSSSSYVDTGDYDQAACFDHKTGEVGSDYGYLKNVIDIGMDGNPNNVKIYKTDGTINEYNLEYDITQESNQVVHEAVSVVVQSAANTVDATISNSDADNLACTYIGKIDKIGPSIRN